MKNRKKVLILFMVCIFSLCLFGSNCMSEVKNQHDKEPSENSDANYNDYYDIKMDQNGGAVRYRKGKSNCELVDFESINKGMTKEQTIICLNNEVPDVWKGSANFPESEAYYKLGENASVMIKYLYDENGIYRVSKVLYREGENETAIVE